MTQTAERAEVAEAPLARTRLASRLSMMLLLDLIAIARGEGHVLDTLLASAIIQANVQEILRRADLQLAYSTEDAMPPDELRRPVSMNAVAASLQLPFETVRRRVTAMAKTGFCRFVDGGVIVPSEALADPKYYWDGFRGYERIRAAYYQFSDLGLLGELPASTVDLSTQAFPIRAVARLMGAATLRVVERFGAVGDLVDSLVALEVYRGNIERLALTASASPDAAPDGVADEAERRPVAVSAVAERLGMPHETVRRHVLELIGRGTCVREGRGLVVPAQALCGPALGPVFAETAANMQRLFAALAQLGVLDAWDGVRRAAARA
jgi:hypothetical protein